MLQQIAAAIRRDEFHHHEIAKDIEQVAVVTKESRHGRTGDPGCAGVEAALRQTGAIRTEFKVVIDGLPVRALAGPCS
jgi:hypothetical protein